jgi:hypothetical protein
MIADPKPNIMIVTSGIMYQHFSLNFHLNGVNRSAGVVTVVRTYSR